MPPAPDPGRREFVIAVRLNAAERAGLRRLAATERLPVAHVVRRLLLQAILAQRRQGGAAHRIKAPRHGSADGCGTE